MLDIKRASYQVNFNFFHRRPVSKMIFNISYHVL